MITEQAVQKGFLEKKDKKKPVAALANLDN